MKTFETSLIKYLLFGFNLIFAISGIGLIVAGALVLTNVEEVHHFMEGRVLALPVVLIVAGCIVFLVASLGCYGAIRQSYNMLMAFALCLFVILVIELAVGIAAAVYHAEAHSAIETLMKDSMNRYEETRSDKIAWDTLQSNFKCCGVDSFKDWKNRPASCCYPTRAGATPPDPSTCANAKLHDDIIYTSGCLEVIEMKTKTASKVLIGIGIGIAFVEVVGILLACWLASAIKKRS